MKLYIYGAGKCGHYVYDRIERCAETNIKVLGWIDNEESKKTELNSLTEAEFMAKGKTHADAVLVAVENREVMTQIVLSLLSKGIVNIYVVAKNLYTDNLEVINEQGQFGQYIKPYSEVKPYLRYLQYPVTMHCNLNCRRCAAFSNLYEEKYADLEMFEKSLYGLKDRFILPAISLLGGEPLLNPQLPEFVEKVHEVLLDTRITIVTNGLLLLKMDEKVIEVLKKHNVRVRITQYPVTARMIPDMVTFLEKNNLKYSISPLVEEFDRFLHRKENKEQIGRFCANGRCNVYQLCYHIYNGRICTCNIPFDLYMHKDYLGLDITKEEVEKVSVDLTNGKENGWEILIKINTIHELCRYCGEIENEKWSNVGEPCVEDYIV